MPFKTSNFKTFESLYSKKVDVEHWSVVKYNNSNSSSDKKEAIKLVIKERRLFDIMTVLAINYYGFLLRVGDFEDWKKKS